jgi:hypothetical protein
MNTKDQRRGTERKLVTRLEDIPETFSSREEEAEWWDSHDVAANLLESGPVVRTELFEQLGVSDPSENRDK